MRWAWSFIPSHTETARPFSSPCTHAANLDKSDADTNILRLGARDYDFDIARWTAKDPIIFAGHGTNLYSYASDDPANRIDPTGTEDITLGDQFAAVTQAGVLAGLHTLGVAASICGWTAAATAVGLDIRAPELFASCKFKKSKCDRQYYDIDIPTCNAISRRRGSSAARRCFEFAAERYAECLRKRPMRPLDTWNN